MRILVCAALTIATLVAAPAAMADGPYAPVPDATIGMKIMDLGLVRPVSIAIALASTGAYLGTLPLTYPIGAAGDLMPYMVAFPWRFTSMRYYGNFSEYRDGRNEYGWGLHEAH